MGTEAPITSRYVALNRLVKTGAMTAAQAQLRRDAAQYVVNMLLAAMGGGVLARGAIGVGRFLDRPPKHELPSPYAQRISMPRLTPGQEDEDEDANKFAHVPVEKHADDEEFSGWLRGPAAKWLYENVLKGKKWWQGGESAQRITQIPAVLGVGFPAAVLAAMGGYKGTDWLLDRRRRAEKEDELQHVRQQYQEELARNLTKRSNDELLDELAIAIVPQLEKQANIMDTLKRGGLWAAGGLGAYAILMSLLAGKLTHDWYRRRSERAVTEEALRRRAKQRAGGFAPAFMTTEPDYV